MTRNDITKATAALAESVASIFNDDDADDETKNKALAESFSQYEKYMSNLGKQADDGDATEKGVDHHASTVADLLVESGRFPHRAAALDHLLGTGAGQALLGRMHKKDTPMEPIEIMKRHPLAFCKVVAEDGNAHGVGEHELVAVLTKHASELYPGMSANKAFAKLYENPDVWRACAVAKNAPFLNAGGAPVVNPDVQVVTGTDVNPNDVSAAMEALHRTGRLQWPELSSEQSFSRAFTDPKNAALAARAHRRPSAV